VNPFERALIDLRIARGAIIRDKDLVKFTAHDQEVIRLASLLRKHRYDVLTIEDCIGIVYDLLENYRPRVEWEDVTPDADLYSDDPYRRLSGVRYVSAATRLGGREFKYVQRLMGRPLSVEQEESFKLYILRHLGVAVAGWMESHSNQRSEA
jgi:hypothetical protein